MGLIDRFAEKVAEQLQKAPNLPVGSVTLTEQQMRNISGRTNVSYGQTDPLPRNAITPTVPFSPGSPIIPGAINPPSDSGRPDPRRYEYQVAQNINITETRLVPFKTLRAAADQIDILRRCIEVSKAKILGLNWDIVLAEDSADDFIKLSIRNTPQIKEEVGAEQEKFDRAMDLFGQKIVNIANEMIDDGYEKEDAVQFLRDIANYIEDNVI